jgi:GH25 family lysozyme M1 (1,4-beta-N-acetylmuramidase)
LIHGSDISGFQTKWDAPAIVAGGCAFGVVKVTQGNSIVNPLAEKQVVSFVDAGLLTFLYHFAQPNGPNWLEDAAAEAKRLDEIADRFEQKIGKKLFCFLDVERNTPLTPVEKPCWLDWVNEFRRWSRDEGKRPIGFYSGRYFTMDLGFDSSWTNTILWVAQYPIPFRADCSYVDKQGQPFWPTRIYPWWRADLWQSGGGDSIASGGNDSRCPGVEGPCDFNHFAGDRPQLEELIAVPA